MSEIKRILNRLEEMLCSYGFKQVEISGDMNYVSNNLFCIPNYIGQLGFFIEYAHSMEEAQKKWHEDGDSFPLSMGEDAILKGLEQELLRNIE